MAVTKMSFLVLSQKVFRAKRYYWCSFWIAKASFALSLRSAFFKMNVVMSMLMQTNRVNTDFWSTKFGFFAVDWKIVSLLFNEKFKAVFFLLWLWLFLFFMKKTIHLQTRVLNFTILFNVVVKTTNTIESVLADGTKYILWILFFLFLAILLFTTIMAIWNCKAESVLSFLFQLKLLRGYTTACIWWTTTLWLRLLFISLSLFLLSC